VTCSYPVGEFLFPERFSFEEKGSYKAAALATSGVSLRGFFRKENSD